MLEFPLEHPTSNFLPGSEVLANGDSLHSCAKCPSKTLQRVTDTPNLSPDLKPRGFLACLDFSQN